MLERLLSLATHGGEAILYLLVALSLLSLAVVLERFATYARNRIDLPRFSGELVELLNRRELDAALARGSASRSAEAEVASEGLRNFHREPAVAAELMDSMRLRQQQRLDLRLGILGTIGSNAPFVGLLGTVLGIIKAFHDLSSNVSGGPSVVMSGIAEALVATAVGLLTAIPAVVFFNYFKGRQRQILGNIGQLQKLLLACRSDLASSLATGEEA